METFRTIHNTRDSQTLIPDSLINNKSLSPNCRWFLCFMLSNSTIETEEIYDHVKEHLSRDEFFKVFDECMDSGYLYKESLENGEDLYRFSTKTKDSNEQPA